MKQTNKKKLQNIRSRERNQDRKTQRKKKGTENENPPT